MADYEDQRDAGDDSGGGGGMNRGGRTLMYMLVAPAITKWILSQKKYTPRKRMVAAVAFLVAAGAWLVAEELFAGGGNYYTVLDVPVGGSIASFRKAYKRQSLIYHPDKVGATTPEEEAVAQEHFLRIREAYEVLTDPTRKATYDRYGPEMLEVQDNARSNEDMSAATTRILVEMAFFYVQYAVMVFIHTIGQPSNSPARTWSFGGLLGLGVADGMMKFGGANLLGGIFTRMPIFEQINILRSMYPGFMCGLNVYTKLTWIDPVQIYTQKLDRVIAQNEQIMLAMKMFVQATNQRRGGGGEGASPGGASVPGPAVTAQAAAALSETVPGRSKKARGPGVSTAAKGSKAAAKIEKEKASGKKEGAGDEKEKEKKQIKVDAKTILFMFFVFAWWRGWF